MRHRFRRRTAVLAVVAVLAGTAAAIAYATGADSGVVFTACKLNATGTIRLINPSLGGGSLLGHCTVYETQFTWNQQGPPGAAGVNGTNGTDGRPGTNGVAGAQGLKGDPCLASDPACRGPKGADGKDGTNGTNGTNGQDGTSCLPTIPACVGPQGPAGPGGGTLSSLDALDGIACNAAGTAGTIKVTYGPLPAGTVTLACTPAASTLTVTTTGTGSGTVTSNVGGISCGTACSDSYPSETTVTLTASSAGDLFTGWSGACSGTGTCVVTMNADKAVTANFVPGATLSIFMATGPCYTNPLTGGVICPGKTVTSSPAGLSCTVSGLFTKTCGHVFVRGTTVTLTADGSTTWGGECSGTVATCVVTLDASKGVSTTFGP